MYGKENRMNLMNGERKLLESGNGELTLTTHKVRFDTKQWGVDHVTSIMLEELVSCQIRYASNPTLLIVAGFAVLAAIIADALAGVVVALILVAIYFFARTQVISLESASATINLKLSGMTIDKAKEFIDQVEAAKNERYLLLRAGI